MRDGYVTGRIPEMSITVTAPLFFFCPFKKSLSERKDRIYL